MTYIFLKSGVDYASITPILALGNTTYRLQTDFPANIRICVAVMSWLPCCDLLYHYRWYAHRCLHFSQRVTVVLDQIYEFSTLSIQQHAIQIITSSYTIKIDIFVLQQKTEAHYAVTVLCCTTLSFGTESVDDDSHPKHEPIHYQTISPFDCRIASEWPSPLNDVRQNRICRLRSVGHDEENLQAEENMVDHSRQVG